VPVALDIRKEQITLRLKNGKRRLLMKNLRFFADKAGKSFGLTGTDDAGSKQQYVFHKGQFTPEDFAAVIKALEFYK